MATTKRPGITLIPDKLRQYVDLPEACKLLAPVIERSKRLRTGKSVFDYMTDEEYDKWNTMINDALRRCNNV